MEPNYQDTVRVWENVGKKNNDDKTFEFKLVSYNVLAQTLLEAHPYLYKSIVQNSLDWNHRSARIFDDLVELAPDILCLQEVQESHLASFYAKFEDIGYEGIFKKKTGNCPDGCAIYYKKTIFELRDWFDVEFYQSRVDALNRDHVGLLARFAHREHPDSVFVVANTHLLFNPNRSDVRLAQMRLFLAEIERFAYRKTDSGEGYLPIILAGDFNSAPESGVIQLLDMGHVAKSFLPDTLRAYSPDWVSIGVTEQCQHLLVSLNRQEGLDTDFYELLIGNSEFNMDRLTYSNVPIANYLELFQSGTISHPFNFTSVYTKYKPDGSAEATAYQGFWVTVDYIYFSKDNCLSVIDRLRLPTVPECLDGIGRLPNQNNSSDHFILAAVFEYKPKNDTH